MPVILLQEDEEEWLNRDIIEPDDYCSCCSNIRSEMQYFLKPLLRTLANMNDGQLLVSIVFGTLLLIAVVLEIVH